MAVTPGHPKFVPGESSAQAISREFSESLGRDDTAPIDHEGKPDLLVTASVVALADRLAGEPVTDWVSQSVFVPDASARAVLTELDVTITETLGMLADVCARPQDRLDHTTELVRAGLARRVPPRGLTRLASHTADWAGIEYGTVHPLRLLTIRYTADVDFYENRVAAQLVDRLSSYVNRRLAELHVLAAGLADLDEYNRALGRRQSWRAQWRIAQLVSDVMADHRSSVAVVAQSIETLTKLRDSLGMLKGTPLLRRANRRIRLPMRLMRTNLFVQERRYRKVGQLWEGWATHETTAVEWQKQAEARFAAAYGSYVMIMTVRSLTVLGYALESGGTHSVRLRRHGEELTVSSGVEGTVTISTERGALARLLPITVDLSAAVPDHVRAQWVSYLSRDRTVIVVYPGLRSARTALPETDRAILHSSPGGVVPLSPLEIEGEERLARALRWPLQGRRYLDYPLAIETKAQFRPAGWFQAGPRGYVQVLRRPHRDEIDAVMRETTSPQRDDVRRPDEVAGLVISEVDRVMAVIDTCPLCSAERARLQPRDSDTFKCRCVACSATWGLNRCGSCGQRYPFLLGLNAVVDSSDGDRLDMTVGADLLAETCSSSEPGQEPRFHCCWCDHCGGMPTCGCTPRDFPIDV